MPFDFTKNWPPKKPEKRTWPPSGIWTHRCRCENSQTVAVGKGESCNWCGLKEDGTLD